MTHGAAIANARRSKAPPRSTTRRRRLPAQLACAAALAGIVVACGASAARTGPTASSTAPAGASTAAATPSLGPTLQPTLSVPQLDALPVTEPGAQGATVMAPGFGAAWFASSTMGLLRWPPSAASPDPVLLDSVVDVGVGQRSVYALVGGNGSEVIEIDPASSKELRHWRLSPSVKSMVVTPAAVYVDHADYPAMIDRIDLRSGAVRSTVEAALSNGVATGQSLASGDGLIWMTDGSQLLGLDATTLAVRRTGHLTSAVDDLWFGDGALWAAGQQPMSGVHRIDPESVAETARVAADAVQIAFSERGVWLSAAAGPTELDPTTASVIGVLPPTDVLDSDAFAIGVLDGQVWVVYKGSGMLQRIRLP